MNSVAAEEGVLCLLGLIHSHSAALKIEHVHSLRFASAD
jgi:hypothetical protein